MKDDPSVALVGDECDLATGRARQVIARGLAELVPFDVARGRRKLARHLGVDEALRDARFVHYCAMIGANEARCGCVWCLPRSPRRISGTPWRRDGVLTWLPG